jgi:hypothetical protein
VAILLTLALVVALAGAALVWQMRRSAPAVPQPTLPPAQSPKHGSPRAAFVRQQWAAAKVDPAKLSAFSHTLARDAELAFEAGADIAAVLMAQAAMEAHLRYELHLGEDNDLGFLDLIDEMD